MGLLPRAVLASTPGPMGSDSGKERHSRHPCMARLRACQVGLGASWRRSALQEVASPAPRLIAQQQTPFPLFDHDSAPFKPQLRQDSTSDYVALHYIDEAGRPQKLRATDEHLVYLAARHLAVNKAVKQLPPGSATSRADMVRPGDLLAVRSLVEEGSFYAARVVAVTRWAPIGGIFSCCRLHTTLPASRAAAIHVHERCWRPRGRPQLLQPITQVSSRHVCTGANTSRRLSKHIHPSPRALLYYCALRGPTREVARGAFAPALTNAGLPLVDGAAAFPWVHPDPNTRPHSMINIGEFLRWVQADVWGHLSGATWVGHVQGEASCQLCGLKRAMWVEKGKGSQLPFNVFSLCYTGQQPAHGLQSVILVNNQRMVGQPAQHSLTCPTAHPRRHFHQVAEFEASLASGCEGAACPCLDAPDDRTCTRLGDRLSDLPPGYSDFSARWEISWNERAMRPSPHPWIGLRPALDMSVDNTRIVSLPQFAPCAAEAAHAGDLVPSLHK